MVKPADAASTDRPAPPGPEKIVESIGPKIRELRLQQKLSLQQLAVRAEVSAAAIHKVERGDMVPTVTTLLKVAAALGRPAGYFIEGAAEEQVAVHSRAKDREPLPGGAEGTQSLLFSGPANRFQLHGTVEVLEPGTGGSAEPARPPAGEEIVFVLDGGLEFTVGDEHYALAKADSLHYRTDHPRRWTNQGRRTARLLRVSLGSA